MPRVHINMTPCYWMLDKKLKGEAPTSEEMAILRAMNDGAIIKHPDSDWLYFAKAFGEPPLTPRIATRDVATKRYVDTQDLTWEQFGTLVSKGLIEPAKTGWQNEWDTTLKGFNYAYDDERKSDA